MGILAPRPLGHLLQQADESRADLLRVRRRDPETPIAKVVADEHGPEGLPPAVIEAMLLARPVVSTRADGVDEWVDDGVHGFLVERPDADSLAEALERL